MNWLCLCGTKYVNEFNGFYHWHIFDIPKIAFFTFILFRLQIAQHDTILILALRWNIQWSHIHGIDVRPYHIFSRYIDIPTLHTANMIACMEWALSAAVKQAQSTSNYVVFFSDLHMVVKLRGVFMCELCVYQWFIAINLLSIHMKMTLTIAYSLWLSFFVVSLNIY